MKLRTGLLSGTAAIFALGAAAQAFAADTDTAAPIETLTVTARRVSENVQQIPVAVTPVSGQDLRNRNIQQLDDLVAATPGLAIAQAESDPSSASLVIRGQGAPDTVITTDPSVGIYIDGVYMPRSTGLQYILRDTDEIGQAEVLRGPQGTLFGRNTTGGALNITSKAPGPDFGMYAKVGVGNYNLVDVTVGGNLPLGDNAGLRLGYEHGMHGGYGQNAAGHALEDEDFDSFHARFSANLNDRLKIDLSGNYLNLREGEAIVKFQGFNPASLATSAGQGVIADVLIESGLALTPANFPVGIGILDSLAGGSPYQTGGKFDSTPEYARMYNGSFSLAYKLNDNFTVKSITGYVHSQRSNALELDATPFSLLHVPYYTYSNFVSEELQLLFKYKNFDAVAGGYFSHEHGEDYSFAQALPLLGAQPFTYDGFATNKSGAGFVQANFHATDKLTFTGGVRYTSESKELDSLNRLGGPNQPGYVQMLPSTTGACNIDPTLLANPNACEAILKHSYSAFTWTGSADYKLTSNMLVYAKASRGYRGGGENIRGGNSLSFQPFSPEFVIQYEVGAKATFLDGRARINTDGYYTDYSDIQVSTLLNVNGVSLTTIQNAAKARVEGFEFEGTLVPVRHLTLNAIFNYTDLKYQQYQDGNIDRTPTPQQFPKYSYDILAKYDVPVAAGVVSFQADYFWQDKYYSGVGDQTAPCAPSATCLPYTFNTASDINVPSRGLLNARINLHIDKWQTDIALWGSNITGKEYAVNVLNPFGPPFNISYIGQPRTYGIKIRKAFGGH